MGAAGAGGLANAALGMGADMALRVTPKFWQDGVCSCCSETQSCCDVICCAPCQISRQCQAVDGTKDKMDWPTCLLGMVLMYYGGSIFLISAIRYRIVAKYNIQMETAFTTGCLAVCCPVCSLCQTNRFLTMLGENPGGTCCTPPTPPMAGVLLVSNPAAALAGKTMI